MKFSEMPIDSRTIAALERMGYVVPTPVQEQSIPYLLRGEEVIVRSQTGTGKTAVFGVGLIEQIAKEPSKKALILAPTRELTLQITKELRAIAQNHRLRINAIYGGQNIDRQIDFLRGGFDIIVATPGRLLDHVRRGTVNLGIVNCVVLDEADRMLDMGFKEDIDALLDQVNPKRQMSLFSATIDGQIKALAQDYMHRPHVIEIGEVKVASIDEEFIELSRREKISKLKEILRPLRGMKTIIFVATKRATEFVCRRLAMDGFPARYLHGDKSQNQRERTVHEFKEGRFSILVATDVAARGLHIDDVSHIINYDRAESEDMHFHRIGRTGRMGKKGKAITFVEIDAPVRSYMGRGRGGGYHSRRDDHRPYRPRRSYDPYALNIGKSVLG